MMRRPTRLRSEAFRKSDMAMAEPPKQIDIERSGHLPTFDLQAGYALDRSDAEFGSDLDGAFVYDLEDLERVALSGKAAREAALESARAILDDEVATDLHLHHELAVHPAGAHRVREG